MENLCENGFLDSCWIFDPALWQRCARIWVNIIINFDLCVKKCNSVATNHGEIRAQNLEICIMYGLYPYDIYLSPPKDHVIPKFLGAFSPQSFPALDTLLPTNLCWKMWHHINVWSCNLSTPTPLLGADVDNVCDLLLKLFFHDIVLTVWFVDQDMSSSCSEFILLCLNFHRSWPLPACYAPHCVFNIKPPKSIPSKVYIL